MDNEYLERIKYILGVINPISLESLAFHMEEKVETLKELLVKFIHDGQLNAKIINKYIYYAKWETDFYE